MGYRNLQECVIDLEQHKKLVRIDVPLDPHLEIGALQRRVYQVGGEYITSIEPPTLLRRLGRPPRPVKGATLTLTACKGGVTSM